MNNFLLRTFSAIGFAAIILGAIWLGPFYAGAVFFLAGAFTLMEFYKLCGREGFKPSRIVGLLLHLVIFAWLFKTSIPLPGIGSLLFATVIVLIVVALLLELFGTHEKPFANAALTVMGNIYVSVAFALLVTLYDFDLENPTNSLLFSVFFLIWTNDTGAYMVGSAFGRHKLFPRVSPGKTWEGSIGGLVFVGLLCWALPFIFPELSFAFLLPMGILVAFGATIGDLIESRWKRSLGIKDSGKFLPGHGGFLDRFDALLITSPLVFAYCLLFS